MSNSGFLTRLSVINYAPMHRLAELHEVLEEANYHVLHIDGAGVSDADAFLKAVSAQLLEGELISNWDSFADVMENYIASLDSDRTALIWSDTQNMLTGHLGDLIMATNVLTGVSRELYVGHHTFVTFLIGTGSNFE